MGLVALVGGAVFLLYGPGQAPDPIPQAPPPAPAPLVKAPEVRFSLPQRRARSSHIVPTNGPLDVSRQILAQVVDQHARDPKNPWAVGHALMVHGPHMKLTNGAEAIPFLFEEYAQKKRIGADIGVGFPRSRGTIRIEPHTDLLLKFFTEVGLAPSETFMVEGEPHTVEELYQHSLWRSWVDPRGRSSFDSLGDAPWALQALTAYAPADLEWTAQQGHPMNLDLFTDVVIADLDAQTRFMKRAMAKGETVKKERQGIFSYTCGGAHSLQAAGFAVARGFGSPTSKQRLAEQIKILFWRYDIELKVVDDLLLSNPEYAHLLLNQRLKFLGHFLETMHKFAAMGLFKPTLAQRNKLDDARFELAKTVQTIQGSGIFSDLHKYKDNTNTYQVYLDYVGDAAHAIRGIDLSTGAGEVLY